MASNEKDDVILEVNHLKMYFPTQVSLFKSAPLKAVDDVSFKVKRGETLGIVGESGCGKTTLGRTILHLYEPTDGEIIFNGKKIEKKKDVDELHLKAQMVFQDPYSSLDPRMTVEDIIGEPIDAHKKVFLENYPGEGSFNGFKRNKFLCYVLAIYFQIQESIQRFGHDHHHLHCLSFYSVINNYYKYCSKYYK